MLMKAVATTVALLAGRALADDCGYAIVENGCDYEVYVFNTPAAGGGYDTIQHTLAPKATYSQQWTSLDNGMGWSIKLSPNETMTNIMQYEYTYHNDGIIWWDLSDVNGNPWNGNWMVDSTNSDTCHPKQQAYCYSTDDAYGMQACPDQAHIKVTLCAVDLSGNDACDTDAAAATSNLSPAAAASATALDAGAEVTPSGAIAVASTTFTTSSVYTPPAPSAPAYTAPEHTWEAATTSTTAYEAPSSTYVAPTTFATSAAPYVPVVAAISSAPPGYIPGEVIVTDTDVAVVTEIVTATTWAKRHEHHARHPHHPRA